MNIQDIRQGTVTIIELKQKRVEKRTPAAPAPVRLIQERNTIIVKLLDGDGYAIEAEPIDKKNEVILNQLLTRNLPSVSVLLTAEKDGTMTIRTKSFADEMPMDISIGIEDDFIEKVRKQAKIDNIRSPEEGLTGMFILSMNGQQYAVMGVHIGAEKKDRFSDFILGGKEGYIQIKRRTDENGGVYFVADHILARIDDSQYAFTLIKGRIEFKNATFMEQARLATIAVMSEYGSSIEGYLNTWEHYGRIEQQSTFEKVIKAGAVQYSSWEHVDGGRLRLHIENVHALHTFAQEGKKGMAVILCKKDPSSLFGSDFDIEWYKEFLRNEKESVTVSIERNIEVQEERIFINKLPEDALPPASGYISLSLAGDIERFRRRSEARDSILNVRNPMPQLAAILEGKSIAKPLQQRHEPISSSVRTEIFPTNDPTPIQKEAIDLAINTPDIVIIQGPPGTGKTTVIRAILKRLNEIGGASDELFGKNLVTAYQHDAVQNAVERIEILGMPAIKIGSRSDSISDNVQVIELMVENWINERLHKLYSRYPDIVKNNYMATFDDLYNNYLYSSNSLENTLRLLEAVRESLLDKLSTELLMELSRVVSQLRMTASAKHDPSHDYLIRSVRRIPTTMKAYEDNGKEIVMEAVFRLKQEGLIELETNIVWLEEFTSKAIFDELTFEQVRSVRKRILASLIPEESIFHTPKQKDEILALFSRISDHLRAEFNMSKSGEDAVLQEYILEYANSPLSIRNTILEYVSVLGVTNQQVMGHKVTKMKGETAHYDNVLVDEAARSNPLDLFIPLSLAKDRIILVGDHRQLPHIVDEKIVEEIENNYADGKGDSVMEKVNENIKKSMFQHLFQVLKKLEKIDGIKRTVTLDKQYRMHPVLGDFVSKNFYERHGEVYIESPLPESKFSHQLPGLEDKACVWYDVPYAEGGEVDGQSKSRPVEAARIAHHLKALMDADAAKGLNFGIISFYKEQVETIYKELVKVGIAMKSEDDDQKYEIISRYKEDTVNGKKIDKLRIGTVDAFQGMEFDVVYLSMVRSNPHRDGSQLQKQKKYGHLMIENRLCVSMSRQKRLLIVVGDSGMLQGAEAEKSIPALTNYYSLCKGERQYGQII
jgi:hypothetical protein